MSVFKLQGASKKALGLFLAIFVVLLMTVSVAYAMLFTISTTDGNIDEWTNQNVPLFQTDAVGDVSTADEDIVNAWVAAEDGNSDGTGDTINFLVEVNGSPALDTNQNPPFIYRVVVATLDCNNNNFFEDQVDRLIIYNPQTDFVEIRNGDQSIRFGPPGAIDYGQRINQYLEWGIPVELMGGGDFDEPPGHCGGAVGVRFVTVAATALGNSTIDDTDPIPWGGIDIPTAVSVSNFSVASASISSIVLIALVGLAIISGMGGVILLRRRQ